MFTRTIGRFGAAALLAVGVLVATAVPAAASATHVQITTSSTINIHNPTTSAVTASTHTSGGTTPTVCATTAPPQHIPVSLDSTSGGTVGAASTTYSDFVIGANTFKARLNIVSGSATFSTTGVTINLTVNAEFRNCASTTLLCRTNNVSITLTGTNPTGTHHPTVSTTFTVAGTSAPITLSAVPACNIIIRGAILNNVANASLNLHFTDSVTPPPG